MVQGTATERRLMDLAVAEAGKSVPAEAAYCVGAVLVAADGSSVLSTGFSRELAGNTHAEQVCLLKVAGTDKAPLVPGATMYTTMEPCSLRLSGNVPCVQRLIDARVARVVVGVREPPDLVQNCTGVELLEQAGIQVVLLDGFRGGPSMHTLLLRSSLAIAASCVSAHTNCRSPQLVCC
ncbi:cytidine deaminase-like protein [Entophlyctis helioformis]|nr:cytidine deaminase-like protein [Entophlyctis helioformis]